MWYGMNVDYSQWVAQNTFKIHTKKEAIMDTKTAEALEGSIEKWEKIVRGEGKDEYNENCPLCKEFKLTLTQCGDCPVNNRNSRDGCTGTPWTAWDKHQKKSHSDSPYRVIMCTDCKDLAQQEVDFLKSLREPEVKKIEPQAGDVWIWGFSNVIFVHGHKGALRYTFSDSGTTRGGLMEYSFDWDNPLLTRIFSLQEYLKGQKEEGKKYEFFKTDDFEHGDER